jgi:imidazolonepropionase-like amidohydrolase
MNKIWQKRFILLFPLMFFGLVLLGKAKDVLVIKAKKIYTVTQGIIENGIILIEDGRITQVGKNFNLPSTAKVMTAQVVIPGLIDIHTHVGVWSLPLVKENEDINEMTNPLTPQMRALDSFNFDDPAIEVARSGGVTTIISRPGSANVIGGTSVAIKLKNASPDKMILKEICDLKMAIEGNPVGVYNRQHKMPSTLMSVYFLARKAFLEAQEYQHKWAAYRQRLKKGVKGEPPEIDLGKEILVKALKREIPVHIHCATASEIINCIRLAREFNLQLSLGHCYWAYLIADDLSQYKDVHFNIGPPMFFNYFENPLRFKNNPAILSQRGLKVSLQTDAIGGGQQHLLHLARLCVRYGMDKKEALKAVTINAADAVNLDDRLGSIEKGKDADLVFLNGDPLEMLTSVEKVLIEGKVEYTSSLKKIPPLTFSIPQRRRKNLVIPFNLEDENKFLIKDAFILTMAGSPLEKGDLLVVNGKIEKVAKEIPIKSSIPVIRAQGYVVLPGLISARSFVGISSNWRQQASIDEISKPVVPELEVKYAVEPQAPHFSFCRQVGITSILVTPGNKNVIGGQGVVLHTTGNIVDKMVLKDQAVMMFGLGAEAKRPDQLPSTRMGIMAVLRETLIRAQEYRKKLVIGKEKKIEVKRDFSLEALIPVLERRQPVIIHCERKDDILRAIKLADEFGLKIILDGATDAYKLVEKLKVRKIPVIIEDLFRGTGNIEDIGFNPQSPAILSRAGIKIAFRAREGSWYTPGPAWPGGDLLEIAAFAVKNGLSEEEALRAVTRYAAEIIGMDNEIGSLQSGKRADLVILSGHPFRTESVPVVVFIDGKIVYRQEKTERVY